MKKVFENPWVAIGIIIAAFVAGWFIGRSDWFNNLVGTPNIAPPPPPPDDEELLQRNTTTPYNGNGGGRPMDTNAAV